MTIWYKKLNRTLNCARSKKRLLCSCTHGQKNGFSEARRCQKILWIQKPKRFVCATLFFVLLILFDSQLIISFHTYIVKLNLLKGFTRTITQCNGFRALGWIAFVAAVDATGRQLRQWKASQSKSFFFLLEGVNMLSFSNIHFVALLIIN